MFQCSTCIRTHHWDCLMQLRESRHVPVPQLGNWTIHKPRRSSERACGCFTTMMPAHVQTIRRTALSSLPGPLRGATQNLAHGRTESETWLVNWEPTWEAAKMIRSSPNYVKMAEEYETSNISTSDIRTVPTDKNKDNLARQGLEDPNRRTPQWKFTLGKHIWDKVHYDMQPIDPQKTIKGTGNCELWNRQVDLIIPPPVQETTHDSEQYDTPSQPPQAEDWLTKFTLPKFQTLQR